MFCQFDPLLGIILLCDRNGVGPHVSKSQSANQRFIADTYSARFHQPVCETAWPRPVCRRSRHKGISGIAADTGTSMRSQARGTTRRTTHCTKSDLGTHSLFSLLVSQNKRPETALHSLACWVMNYMDFHHAWARIVLLLVHRICNIPGGGEHGIGNSVVSGHLTRVWQNVLTP